MAETRGKIVLLQEFQSSPLYGIEWKKFEKQDDWKIKNNWCLYDKWQKVKKHLELANKDEMGTKYINFFTASGGSFPYFVASGQSSHQTNAPQLLTGRTTPGWKNSWPDFPRINCCGIVCSIAFEGINNLAAQRIGKNLVYNKKVGIIMIDFPGPDLISKIIELN